jgi:AcrR family transcriptional regulator
MNSEVINPPRKKRQWNSTEKRRREILDAALTCFLKSGVAGTTIEQIRAASKASHGSIYHLFGSKDEIALTLFVEGMQLYHEKIVQAMEHETTARGLVQAIVTTHLKDVLEDPALSIYLTRMNMADDLGHLSQQFRLLNDEFAQEIWLRLEPFVERGEMVRLPMELYFSLIIGPTSHLARSWLRGRVDFDPLSVIEHMAGAAWKSLQAD